MHKERNDDYAYVSNKFTKQSLIPWFSADIKL